MASAPSASNTPAAIHTSRRPRIVVSDYPVAGETLGVNPGAPSDESDQDGVEAAPVRRLGPVTAEWVLIGPEGWQQRLRRRPDGLSHFRVQSAHDKELPAPWSLGLGRTRHQNRATPTTGGWSSNRATCMPEGRRNETLHRRELGYAAAATLLLDPLSPVVDRGEWLLADPPRRGNNALHADPYVIQLAHL